MQSIKLIVTSKGNLKKYGNKVSLVTAELRALQAHDLSRQIKTTIVYIDDKTSMKAHKMKPVTVTERNCKQVIDALYKKYKPDYITILGSDDVIPFQKLVNEADDPDLETPSDLPYACDVPFSTHAKPFSGPTRVVGRIPDIPGASDPKFLIKVLQNARKHKPRNCEDYERYFAITAKVWTGSTTTSVRHMFGTTKSMVAAPTAKGPYTKAKLAARTHFFNCHGGGFDPAYYGEGSAGIVETIHSQHLEKKITASTVVAAECCYGAQVFDPAVIDGSTLSMAAGYFQNGAISLVGSSNIAYGPEDGQGLADLITQYFIKRILGGASAGRALLEARQEFLNAVGPDLDPYELKTLAQFYLLGDPSVHPATSAKDLPAALEKSQSNTRENRRMSLVAKGTALQDTIAPSTKISGNGVSKTMKKILRENRFKIGTVKRSVFQVQPKSQATRNFAKQVLGSTTRFRTFVEAKTKTKPHSKSVRASGNRLPTFRVLVVKENGGKVLGHRTYVSR